MKKTFSFIKNIGVFFMCFILTAGLISGIKFVKNFKLAKTGVESQQQTFIHDSQNENKAQTANPNAGKKVEIPESAKKGMSQTQKDLTDYNSQTYDQVQNQVDSKFDQIQQRVQWQKAHTPAVQMQNVQRDVENAMHQ